MIGEPAAPTSFDAAGWAGACRDAFAKRQPGLIEQVWDDVWLTVPYFYNLWVVAVKRLDRHGVIVIPEEGKRARLEGWVVSVGPGICYPGDPIAQKSAPYTNPIDMVGRRVFWGQYSGTPLASAELSTADLHPRNILYPGQYVSLSIADVLGESLKEGGTILATAEEIGQL